MRTQEPVMEATRTEFGKAVPLTVITLVAAVEELP
jgi:hypothetical protein